MRRPAGIVGLANIVITTIRILAQYRRWWAKNALTPDTIDAMRVEAAALRYQPVISILMPVYESDERWLRLAVDSVLQQVYPHVELCLVDDASTRPHIRPYLEELCRQDARVKVVFRQTRGHIAEASNTALALATGEFIALVDHDDEVSADALFEVVRLLNEHPDADFVYSDEDKLEPNGDHTEPFFKPDWSPHLLLSINYVTHLAVLRRSLVEQVGGFRADFIGSQDHDLFLRFTQHTERIYHIPKILYSWRKTHTSTALRGDTKNYALEAADRAIAEAVRARGLEASVEEGGYPPFHRIRFSIKKQALVSVIARAREGDQAGLLKLDRKTAYPHREFIPIASSGNMAAALNSGARLARGEVLLFADALFEPVNTDWLEAMLEYAQLSDVACVGAKILSPRHFIRHAGMAIGLHGTAGAVECGIADVPHPLFYLNLKDAVREVSAVSAQCLLVKQGVFQALGGFEEAYKDALYDADFCLRAREIGFTNLYTPYAEILSRAAEPICSAEERDLFRSRWQRTIDHDPYYSPHLSRTRGDFSLRVDE